MNLEDFDHDEEVLPAPVPSRDEREAEQTQRFRNYRNTREILLSPEVAKALREGWTYTEIANAVGVTPATVAKYAKSEEMSLLIEREARRVLRHLTKRDLKDEKYRDLSVSLGVLIDKARLLRNEPTEIVREERTSVDRVALLLFGEPEPGAGITESGPVIEITPEPGTECLPGIPEQPEQIGSDEGGGGSAGSE